jgi:Leucine-rich repeat (LRR) protein
MKQNLCPRLLLLCSLFITISTARAQYVAIPDTNFGAWLYTHGYDSCLTGSSATGWQLDTACSALPLAVAVDVSYQNISNLSGVKYFRHLRSLYCDRNALTSLPTLPALLTYINCSFNQITTITALPDSLVTLECSNNLITSLPTLPATITQINCSSNQLSSLPTLPTALQGLICATNGLTALPALPSGLLSMDCSYNQLTALPIGLPSVMINLLCEDNQITVLPPLPDSLRFLDCSHNLLPGINPVMPSQLLTLDCSYNQIIGLGSLDTKLKALSCGHNQLTFINSLPDTLTGLDCSYNKISTISNLPYDLTDLDCSYNPTLACLPIIYQSQLNTFYIDSTAIVCVPDSFTAVAYDVRPDSLPLCTAASGCPYGATTGIAQLTSRRLASLYSNPNRGSFTLQTSGSVGATYTISDMLGDVIEQQVISTDTQAIDLTGAADGIYTLVVRGSQPVRFVVMR